MPTLTITVRLVPSAWTVPDALASGAVTVAGDPVALTRLLELVAFPSASDG
jgi:hypothetical protein